MLCKALKGLNGQAAAAIVLAPPNWGIDALAKVASYSEHRSVDRTRRRLRVRWTHSGGRGST